VAKDGAQFALSARVEREAAQWLAPWETMDVLVTPSQAGE
jgi:hypothetical protein